MRMMVLVLVIMSLKSAMMMLMPLAIQPTLKVGGTTKQVPFIAWGRGGWW